MKTICLIRHGKTGANVRHLYHGSTDLELCEEGEQELFSRRRTFPGEWKFITSGMKRTEQTLKILFGDVPHAADPRFREMDFGEFEMRSYQELKDEPDYQRWISGDNASNRTPGGESGRIMERRVLEGFVDLMNSTQDIVLVTHGGPITAIMAHLFPGEEKNRYQWQPSCGGGYVLTFDADGWNYRPLE